MENNQFSTVLRNGNHQKYFLLIFLKNIHQGNRLGTQLTEANKHSNIYLVGTEHDFWFKNFSLAKARFIP